MNMGWMLIVKWAKLVGLVVSQKMGKMGKSVTRKIIKMNRASNFAKNLME